MAFPTPGSTWAGFHIESQIGAGGFGRVYAAWDPELERRVAIKVLNPEHVDSAERERFLRESRTAGALDHPRILPIHQANEHDGIPYIVMRYVGGGDVRSAIRQGPLSAARTDSVITQIAEALDRAHRSGLVHRDVKPANILCAADSDDVYLTDFGITRPMDDATGSGITQTGRPPASPHYAAPEQLRGESVSPATDVYSLGCTAFECLTGRVPFPGDSHIDVSHQQLHAAAPLVSRFRPDLPVTVDAAVAQAMAKDPENRYPTAGAFAEALAAALSDERPRAAVRAAVPVAPGRSIFDDATAVEPPAADTVVAPAPPAAAVDDAPTVAVPVAESAQRVVEVPWEGWDDAEDDVPTRPSRAAWVVGALFAVAVLVVGALVVRAANTDGGAVALGDEGPPAATAVPDPEPVTAEDVFALIPDGLGDCNEVPDAAVSAEGAVQVACTRETPPQVVTFTLFSDPEARDAAFNDAVDSLELADAGTGECALGDLGTHAFTGDDGTGRVACRSVGPRTDIVWAGGTAPLLASAGGDGPYPDQYAFWSDLVGRVGDEFPMDQEQALLDGLVEDHTEDCRRDLGLALTAGGTVAVACEPEDEEPDVISWVSFATDDSMDAWLDGRRASLGGTVDSSDDACDPDVFGRPVKPDDQDDEDDGRGRGNGNGNGQRSSDDDGDEREPMVADVGSTTYELDGSTGSVLCFRNTSGQNVLFWTRDDERIGSIAVSDADDRDMKQLLEWFEKGGHRP